MNEPFDDDLGPLLRDYLSSQLDGQLGKAPARFAEGNTVAPAPARRRGSRGGRLLAAAAVIAAALAVAVLCGVQLGRRGPPERNKRAGEVTASKTDTAPEPDRSPAPAPQAEQEPLGGRTADQRSTGRPASGEPLLVGQQVQWRTIDEGIVYLDPYTPVRKLRRQRLERVEWYDAARGARVQMVVPREEVQFVALPSS